MIFPGSRVWHEGAATDLVHLTDEMKSSSFSGHIVLEFQESLDLVIVAGGDFFKVIEKIGRRIMTTKKYREIWGKCQIKTGRMFAFELPPPLALKLQAVGHRKELCSGEIDSCDLGRVVRERKAARFSGFIESVSSDGKGLLEMKDGVILSCWYTEYQGLSYRGFDGFVRWHENLQRPDRRQSVFLAAEGGGGDFRTVWEEILTAGMDEVRLPLRPVGDRLFSAFGRTAFDGEQVFTEGERLDKAFFLLEGEIELSRRWGGRRQVIGRLGAGSVLGLSWLNGRLAPPMTGTAASNCRILSFDRPQLDQILFNSPRFGASLIAKAASQLRGVSRRKSLFTANPRLRDLETFVVQILNGDPVRLREGLAPGDLFRELTQVAPFTLPEMDQMVRDLVNAGRFVMAEGKVSLQPEEI